MPKAFLLVDCNNFYVSCERAFAPKLENIPVVVLSNNDGCIVARSNEIKNLGIPMGAPFFKYKDELAKIGCRVFSSNYSLYGDMSARIMNLLCNYTDAIEVYSIDEAFLELDLSASDLVQLSYEIKDYIKKCTGIPVSIGIATTKTLAKLANEIAKKDNRSGGNEYKGVFSFLDHDNPQSILDKTKVGDIWGIGRQYAKMLNLNNILTVTDLVNQKNDWIKDKMTIQGARIVNELRGIRSLELEQNPPAKKNIASTRSFGRPVTKLAELEQAVSSYCTTAGQKLRREKEVATVIQVFVMTDRFKTAYAYKALTLRLESQTNYTPELIKTALKALGQIYQKGVSYKKAGIILSGLVNQDNILQDLFASPNYNPEKNSKISTVIDTINKRFGKNKVRVGAFGYNHLWAMNRNMISPRYTTNWKEMLAV